MSGVMEITYEEGFLYGYRMAVHARFARSLMRNLGISAEEAMNDLEIPDDERAECMEELEGQRIQKADDRDEEAHKITAGFLEEYKVIFQKKWEKSLRDRYHTDVYIQSIRALMRRREISAEEAMDDLEILGEERTACAEQLKAQ